MKYYNCHAHIFNYDCIPPDFLRNRIKPAFITPVVDSLLRKEWFASSMSWVLGLFGSKSQAGRLAEFVKIGKLAFQEDIFRKLQSEYESNYSFVLLTMDFDFMGAGLPNDDFLTQLAHVQNLKRKYRDLVRPFLGLDPRRFTNTDEMLAFTKHYIEDPNAPFAGLKLYPPHGFYPFHPVFDKTFAFAAQNQIPVLAHCYRGGGSYYAQDSLPPQTFGRVSLGDSDECKTFFTELNQQSDFFRKPMRQQTDVFQHPVCYYDILRKYPQLKLCLAHFGGIDEIKREGKEDTASIFERSWFSIIKDLMLEFPNVYADVSYIFGEIDKKDTIVRDTLFDPKLQDKIMFGSDYYMVVREGDENEMRQKFVDYLGNPTIWDKIAGQNVEAFLNPKPSIV